MTAPDCGTPERAPEGHAALLRNGRARRPRGEAKKA